MTVFVDFKDIIVIAVIFLYVFVLCCVILRDKITEWRKRRARKLLADEIARYERQIKKLEHYGEVVEDMRRREAILCPTLLKGIVDMLPDPNRIINGRGAGTILQGHEVKLFVAGRGEIRFQLKFVVDADDVPTREKGLTVRVEPLGQEVRFTLKLHYRRQRIHGVDVDVNSWYWDLRFSGILILSDEGFGHIIDFVLSSRVVGQELGIPEAPQILGEF